MGAVPVEFDSVLVGVAEVEGFAYAVVGGAIEGDVGFIKAVEGVCEVGSGGVEDGEVEEAGGVGWRRGSAEAFPGIQADVVVIAACGDEGRAGAVALGDVESEDAAVEGEGSFEIGDFQVHVADADLWVDGGCCAHELVAPF